MDVGGCGHELAILMNSAYATLSDPKARQLYDADLKHMRQHIGTFDGRPVSAWEGGPGMLKHHGKVLEIIDPRRLALCQCPCECIPLCAPIYLDLLSVLQIKVLQLESSLLPDCIWLQDAAAS